MTGWIKLVKMKEMLQKAGELYNNRQFDEALGFSKQAVARSKKPRLLERRR